MDWEKYKNCIILTGVDEVRQIPTKIFEKIEEDEFGMSSNGTVGMTDSEKSELKELRRNTFSLCEYSRCAGLYKEIS